MNKLYQEFRLLTEEYKEYKVNKHKVFLQAAEI